MTPNDSPKGWIEETFKSEYKQRGADYSRNTIALIFSPDRFMRNWVQAQKGEPIPADQDDNSQIIRMPAPMSPWQFMAIGSALQWLTRQIGSWWLNIPKASPSLLVSSLEWLKGGIGILMLSLPFYIIIQFFDPERKPGSPITALQHLSARINPTVAAFSFSLLGPGVVLEILIWLVTIYLVKTGNMTLLEVNTDSPAFKAGLYTHTQYSPLEWITFFATLYTARLVGVIYGLSLVRQFLAWIVIILIQALWFFIGFLVFRP